MASCTIDPTTTIQNTQLYLKNNNKGTVISYRMFHNIVTKQQRYKTSVTFFLTRLKV